MNFWCCAVLLLLLGALGSKEESSLEKKTISEWSSLRKEIEREANWREGGECGVDVDLTKSFFLLYFHHNRILEWAWPRFSFYSTHFDSLDAAHNSGQIFCSYYSVRKEERMGCDEGKCAKCEGLRNEANATLKEACRYNGTGGKEAELIPKEGGSLRASGGGTPSDDACAPGWLTKTLSQEFYENTAREEFGPYGFEPCDYFPAVAVAYAYTFNLGWFYSDGAAMDELQEKLEFWEHKLRILKDGKAKDLNPCYPGELNDFTKGPILHYGPTVCGKDRLCIPCSDVTEDMAEIYEACNMQKSRGGEKMQSTSTEEPQMTTLSSNSVAHFHRQFALALFVSTAATILAHYAAVLLC